MDVSIAERLQKLRREHGYSQEQLADELGVSRQAVSKWERSEASPDTDNLIALARLYGVSVDTLLFSEEPAGRDEPAAAVEEGREEPAAEKAEGAFGEDKNARISKITGLASGITVFACLLVYLLAGCVWGLWHPVWIVFLLIPAVASLCDAVLKRDPSHFAYPVAVTAVYLVVGFLTELWHPMWILFVTIPVYYIVCDIVKKRGKNA